MSLTRIKVRRDTAANWAAENPVLADGEPGALVEAGQPSRLKLGDGVTAWADLPFLLDEETGSANYTALGSYAVAPTTGPLVEIGNTGSQSTFHLTTGEGFSGPYVLGIGVDHDDATGFVVSVKADNNVGFGLNLEETAGADSIGLLGANFSLGTLIALRKAGGASGPLVNLRNDYGGTGPIFAAGTTEGRNTIEIGEDGELIIAQDAANPHTTRLAPSGGGNNLGMYQYSGAPGLWFPSAIQTSSNFTHLMAGGAAAIGGESLGSIFKWGNTNQWGFFGSAAGQQTVTGSKGGNAALASLLSILAAHGVVVDGTS